MIVLLVMVGIGAVVLVIQSLLAEKRDAGSPTEPRPIPFPGGASISWSVRDRDQLSAFLKSSTGQRFHDRLKAMAGDIAMRACEDKENVAYSAARAAGYMDAIKHMVNLTMVAEPPAQTTQDREPVDVDDKEAFLARVSP